MPICRSCHKHKDEIRIKTPVYFSWQRKNYRRLVCKIDNLYSETFYTVNFNTNVTIRLTRKEISTERPKGVIL